MLSQRAELHLLEAEAFHAARRAVLERWDALDVRPSSLAGRSLPDTAGELGPYLDGILEAVPEDVPDLPAGATVRAVVAPHIDTRCGGAGYAAAYSAAKDLRPKRVVVLGVGHAMDEGLYCLTDKDFETPLGRVPTDAEAVAALREAGGAVVSPGDFAHKSEHSVELQLGFLQRLLPQRSFGLVPVLCGTARALPSYTRGAFREAAGGFLEALRGLLDEDTLLVAGVDFCHVGPKFGHQKTGRELEGEADAHARGLLGRFVDGDVDGFWEESTGVDDAYNVCGFLALATMLEVLGGTPVLLGHEFWHESTTNSAVSFAALAVTA